MLPWLDAGNASSQHSAGRRARAAIDAARERVAASLDREFADLVFTSGGTEAAVLAVVGAALGNESARTVYFPANEHHCVLHTAELLGRLGYRTRTLPVDLYGRPLPDALEDAALVSVMHANNETGVVNDVMSWQEAAHAARALFHTDAVQTYGRLPSPDADLVSISAHKVGGPKGIGALAIRPGVKLVPLLQGGGQERERRGGTEDVAGIVGFGAVAEPRADAYAGAIAFRTSLVAGGALATIPDEVEHLPGIVHVRFPGQRADTLLVRLDRSGIAASAGAACSSGSLEASHVLLAQGATEEEAREGIRFSFRGDEPEDVGLAAAERVLAAVRAIREPETGRLRHT